MLQHSSCFRRDDSPQLKPGLLRGPSSEGSVRAWNTIEPHISASRPKKPGNLDKGKRDLPGCPAFSPCPRWDEHVLFRGWDRTKLLRQTEDVCVEPIFDNLALRNGTDVNPCDRHLLAGSGQAPPWLGV